MRFDELIDELDEIMEKAWALPLSGGKCMVDAGRIKDIIQEIRLNVPSELKQAKAIVSDRNQIVADAKREAEMIVRRAEERAKQLVSQEEVLKKAQDSAAELLSQAQSKAKEMRQVSFEYADGILKQLEETLSQAINDVRQARTSIHKR